MTELEIRSMIANHPAMRKLRTRQESMRRNMVRDYGHDFMINGSEMPEMILPNGRTSPRHAGVHYWTPAQCAEWNALENRVKNLRNALMGALAGL